MLKGLKIGLTIIAIVLVVLACVFGFIFGIKGFGLLIAILFGSADLGFCYFIGFVITLIVYAAIYVILVAVSWR